MNAFYAIFFSPHEHFHAFLLFTMQTSIGIPTKREKYFMKTEVMQSTVEFYSKQSRREEMMNS